MKKRKSYHKLRVVRLDEENWAFWKELKDQESGTMNSAFSKLKEVFRKYGQDNKV